MNPNTKNIVYISRIRHELACCDGEHEGLRDSMVFMKRMANDGATRLSIAMPLTYL